MAEIIKANTAVTKSIVISERSSKGLMVNYEGDNFKVYITQRYQQMSVPRPTR